MSGSISKNTGTLKKKCSAETRASNETRYIHDQRLIKETNPLRHDHPQIKNQWSRMVHDPRLSSLPDPDLTTWVLHPNRYPNI